MFSLFEKEIPRARSDEGEGSGGKRLPKKERKKSREVRRSRKKRTVGDTEENVAKSFADLDKLVVPQKEISEAKKTTNTKDEKVSPLQAISEDVAVKIASETNGPTLTEEDLKFVNRGNTTKTNTSQKERVTPQKEESTPTDTLNLLKKGDVSVLQQAEGRWKKLSDIKKMIQQTVRSSGYSPEEVDRLFAESINPIATQIWEELQNEKDHDRLNTLHQQFVEKTQTFLKNQPHSVVSSGNADTVSSKKEQEQPGVTDVFPKNKLADLIERENPHVFGHQGNINVHVGGDFTGTVGHGSSVGGNIEMKKVTSEVSGEATIQEKSPTNPKKVQPTTQHAPKAVDTPVDNERKVKTGYRKTQERREYKKGRKKGQEYVVEKWEKNKVDPLENLSNFSREIRSLIEDYRQKLGYDDETIDKQRGTPRYRALQAVNQMLLENGKLTKALEANADEKTLQKILERITKNKQMIEVVLQMPESQWDDIDDLKGVDVYKNMQEQFATAKYDVAILLKTNPEVEDTPEYVVYQQFIDKVRPFMKDEQTMYDSHILVRTTLDSISRQVDAMREKYASSTDENKDVSVSKEEAKPPQEIINWKIGDKVMIPRTDGSESEAVIQINYLDGTVGVKWQENGKELSKIVEVKRLKPVVKESYSSIGEYTKPDESLLQSQEEWRQVLHDVGKENVTDASQNEEVPSGNKFDIQRNRELAKDDPDGLFAWGERQGLLFGMQVPKAGPDGVFGARAFKQALQLVESRTLPELQKDPEKRKQYNEILQIVTNVPESGLTHEETNRLFVLSQSISMSESPLQLDTGRTIDDMYAEVERKIQEKLPTLGAKKKKRGFFGRLARAAVLALPFIATASALDDQAPIKAVEAVTQAPTLVSPKSSEEYNVPPIFTPTQDTIVQKNTPSLPSIPTSETIVSIPTTDIPTMVTKTESVDIDTVEKDIQTIENIEKLKDYTVHKGDNLTFIIEGRVAGGDMLPALKTVPEAQRQHILNHVITALRYSPEKQKEIGITSGNPDLIYYGAHNDKDHNTHSVDIIHLQKLNDLIAQVVKDQGITVTNN